MAVVFVAARRLPARRLQVVAEGVEHRDQLDELRRMGCDQVQGFFISPALPFEELCYFMEAYNVGREGVLAHDV